MAKREQYQMQDGEGATRVELDALASRVISVLCERQTKTPGGSKQFILNYLLNAVRSSKPFDSGRVMAELRGNRLTSDEVIDTYVPEVAIAMGDLWMRDEIDFARVTVGALRLQSLLGEASAETARLIKSEASALGALVVVPQGEQHFLGAHVVAAQLRRLGVAVSISFCEDQQSLVTRVEMEAPDMVLFSCARVEALAAVERTVIKIRNVIEPAPVLAIGGAAHRAVKSMGKQAKVDVTTNAAKDVVGFCAKRLKALAKD